ncbi:CoA transferase [Salinicola sp. MIT1003]|uniref:CaiB/BaiF CoA transferase family protein n=1 Tax=Salinicola sp. MIT1003 TaxID=1882734 RepID=UPI0008DE9C9F|nr:CoA transferase [Salinicola sp. MIT1003]OHZ01612.1 carnitine dehydratase [Salinicola sp. MIT1003]
MSDISSRPLAGYRILDMTTFLSGPFCTQVLADMGADVVKVEAPGGDSSRVIPPHFVGEDSAYYLANNRNKRSLAIDMKSPEGLTLVRRLIGEVDVVVENFRPGVPARLGLDVEQIRAEQPRLIWASISGFGQTGSMRDKPAYDMIVQALSGVMSLTGEPNRPSVRLGIPAGDTVAGLYTAIAINAALADRERCGEGRVVDVSMLDCQLAMLSYQSAYALIAGATPSHQGARHDSIPTYRSFIAGDDRELVITANTERMWQGLCRGLGHSELIDDPRFSDGGRRLENCKALWAILEPAFRQRAATEWVETLSTEGVPVALIKTVPEALEDARTSGRDMILPLEDADGHHIEVVGNPVKFANADGHLARYPPELGRNAAEVLGEWLDMPVAEVEAMHANGVLREGRPA